MSPQSFALRVAPILAIALGLYMSMSNPLSAQTVGGEWTTFHHFDGPGQGQLGHSVSEAGDVNGDGWVDVILGAPGRNTAFVHSGKDWSLLYKLRPDTFFYGRFGFSVAGAGDVNADGYSDLIVGAPESTSRVGTLQAGSAYVFSGRDGSLLYRFDGAQKSDGLGHSVGYAGDVNPDGFADMIVGVPAADPGGLSAAGSAFVYSGLDGNQLFQFDGLVDFDFFGISVAGSVDINGDGSPDLIVGAKGSRNGTNTAAGSAFVFSGIDGSTLLQFRGPAKDYHLGISVDNAGDVNLDGNPDLIFGAHGLGPGGAYSGSAFVHSGSDGSLLFEFGGTSSFDFFGFTVAGAGDVDRDGYPDFIIGAREEDEPGGKFLAGAAYVYSGRDGGLLFRLAGEAFGDQLGWAVAGIGDLDGDGFPEMLVGAPTAYPGGKPIAGSVYVIGIDPFLTADAEALSATNGAHMNLSLDFPATEGNFPYALLLSATGTGPTNLNGVDIPLTADTLFNRMLTGWSPPVLPNAFGTLDLNGDADVLAVSHAYLTPFIGLTYYAAAVSYDPVSLIPRLSSVVRSVVIVP